MDGPLRWVVAILFVAAIIALIDVRSRDARAWRADGAAGRGPDGRHGHLMVEAAAPARHISTQQAAFIGVAAMVGAGIFSLLGAAGEVAGAAVWLSFLLAGAIAALQGYSFAQARCQVPVRRRPARVRQPGLRRGPRLDDRRLADYIANGIVTAMVALSFGSYASSAFAGDNAAWVKIFAVRPPRDDDDPERRGLDARRPGPEPRRLRRHRHPGGLLRRDDRERRAGLPRPVDVSRRPGHRRRAWP